ncbi:MAG: type II toxin-antitoxin system prevent-host-death family antitoxin [Bacteroidetes bacterium]|nr:type II toxin-antitoxin system prevent-host-death family antitoxin [Bacteroidota bacterium]
MHTVTAREARKIFSRLLDESEHGAVVSITRRGQEVARLGPPELVECEGFPDMTEFRNSIKVKGTPTSQVVIEMRNEERY